MKENGPLKKERQPALLSATTSARWVMAIFFCSGVCSLIDEVVWVRLIKLTLGNTVYASSVVVSVFMGGLALGALAMARWADRVARPLRLYALLEIVVALVTAVLPAALAAADGAYRLLFVPLQASPHLLIAMQVIVSSAILLVPTVLMGSTLPLLGRYVTALQERIGSSVGGLYAINTLGAVTGCFLAGFVLMRAIGVIPTLYAAAGLNVLVALAGWQLSGRSAALLRAAAPAVSEKSIPPTAGAARWLLGSLFFASGCISIGYELIWMRSIVIPLGGFTYVFSAVLTIYLLGNVLGVWIGTFLSRRVRNPAFGTALCLSLLGACGIFFVPWLVEWLKRLFDLSNGALLPVMQNIAGWVLVRPLLYCLVLFLPAAMIMGMGFPLALQAWNSRTRGAGNTTGSVYGINTIGAICGGIVTGFVLIPLLGAQWSVVGLGLLGVVLGAAATQAFFTPRNIALRTVYAMLALAVVAAVVLVPSNLFVKRIVAIPGLQTVAVREGVTATVSVTLRPQDGAMELTSDGVRVAGDDIHRSAQQCLGNMGVLLHPDARRVLSVGFGSGETVKCLSRYHLRKIDCVEIAPELIDLACKYFRHINLGDWKDSSLSIISMDAFNYMHVTNRTYDVIINDANLPSHSACAPLFTKEHFLNCANRLNPRGLFFTKLPLADISESSFNSILGTFLEAFPQVTLWFPVTRPYIFFYLIGSRQEMLFSPENIDRMLAADTVRAASGFLRFHSSHDVLSCYIADRNDLSRYLKAYHRNASNTPYIEFNVDQKALPLRPFFKQLTAAVRSASLYNHIDWGGFSDEQKSRWLADQRIQDEATACVLQTVGEEDRWQKLSICGKGLRAVPGNAVLLDEEDGDLQEAQSMLNMNKADFIGDVANAMLIRDSSSAAGWILFSWTLQRGGRVSEALAAAQSGVARAPWSVSALDNCATILLQSQAFDAAISRCDTALRLAPDRARSRIVRGMALYAKGQIDGAIKEFTKVVQLQPRNAHAWCILGDIYREKNERRLSEQAYREALKIDPYYNDAQNGLNALGQL
ncbi:MAG TPA: fused MFS/spermidine synthase [Chitinivibrionales bacterium]|nr:fused MFS/spermidine synthase [Chitinivibrionales bacterium]